MLLNILFSFALLSLSSCTIEGEEICGIWNANGDYGEMQVEITPWKGKFWGYLLTYKNGSETIKGKKTADFIFMTDLAFNEGEYQEGKIYLDPNSETHCGLRLKLLNDHQLQAIYDCDGQTSEEIWYREGHNPVVAKAEDVITGAAEPEKNTTPKEEQINERLGEEVNEKTIPSSPKTPESAYPEIKGETEKQTTFYIIGIQKNVKYDDYKIIEKTMEAMWTEAYNNDFSGKLKNIMETNNMYVSYSNYDNPKGKMTITLGYKVKNLSSVPAGLHGVKIPANEYLVYPMSGDKSDYEGAGWEQMGELMMYRKKNSADFEVYTFDNNYNIKKAKMWIATK